ncbi:MAG TPA: flagellar filament capping protein FliD [Bacteroidota bacterium]|nr:flagellar filament capping protein FliD [Bacteroidota bacterium]
MSTTSSLSATLSTLVSQYQSSLQAQRVVPVQKKQASLTSQLSAYGQLKSVMSTLNTSAQAMAKTDSSSKFLVYNASSSNTGVLSATATASAVAGNHSIKVTQLAKADVVISSRFTSSSATIDTAEMTADEKTAGSATRQFTISIGGSQKATVNVNLTGDSSDTNSAVLTKIASAINASSDASKYVSASVVAVTPTQSRLVITDLGTGSTNAVSVADVGTGTLMQNIGLGADVISARSAVSSSTAADDPATAPGGYLTAGDTAQLDAKFSVDGIDIVRPTNSVSDVLSGVTLQLNGTQLSGDNAVTLTVGTDKSTVTSNIQQFLYNYNNVISYINSQTAIDPSSGTKQQFALDTSVKGIRSGLREIMLNPVSGLASGSNLLSSIGITAASDGTLSITDSSALDAALTSNPKSVSDIFNSTGGIANSITSYLDPYLKTGGQFDVESSSLNSQITSLSKKISDLNDQITKQVNVYKDEFAQLQTVYTEANSQLSMIAEILGTSSG